VSNDLGSYDTAQSVFEEALSISQKIGFAFGISWSLGGLGNASLGQGKLAAARAYFRRAIAIAFRSRDKPIIIDSVIPFARLLAGAATGRSGRDSVCESPESIREAGQAAELLLQIKSHPAAWHNIREDADHLLQELEGELPPGILPAARERSRTRPLVSLAIEILTQPANRGSG
jgi:tetratricopeptide (TPR) repeat protein